jgi:hypothetical protein
MNSFKFPCGFFSKKESAKFFNGFPNFKKLQNVVNILYYGTKTYSEFGKTELYETLQKLLLHYAMRFQNVNGEKWRQYLFDEFSINSEEYQKKIEFEIPKICDLGLLKLKLKLRASGKFKIRQLSDVLGNEVFCQPENIPVSFRLLIQEFVLAKPKILISTRNPHRKEPKKKLNETEKVEPVSKKLRFELSHKDEELQILHAEHDKQDEIIENLLGQLCSVYNILNSNIANFPEIN